MKPKPTGNQVSRASDGAITPGSEIAPSSPRTAASYRRPPVSAFGRYQLLMELARGGMATLYLARPAGLKHFDKLLVLKRVHEHYAEEERFVQMFLDEARISSQLNHPNVASVFDMGEVDGTYFLVMEYVHGQNLWQVLSAGNRRPGLFHWSHAARIAANSAAGLHAAHELTDSRGVAQNVVHRDVSPQNILVTYDGHVKVVDFGIAYAAERLSQTDSGTVKGKAAYMTPEQLTAGVVDRRSDIFALGIVLFEAVCNVRLFKEESAAATMQRVIRAEVPPPRGINPAVPVALEQIILRALEKDPADRFQTAGDMESALERFLVSSTDYVGRSQLADLMSGLFSEQKAEREAQIKLALVGAASADLVEPAATGQTRIHPCQEMANLQVSTATGLEVSSSVRQASFGYRPWQLWLAGGGVIALLTIVLLVVLGQNRTSDRSRSPQPSDAPVSRKARSPKGQGHSNAPLPTVMGRRETGGTEAPAAPTSADERPAKPATNSAREPPDIRSMRVTVRIKVQPKGSPAVVTFRGTKHVGNDFQVVVPRAGEPERIRIQASGYHPESVSIKPDRDVELTVTLRPKYWRPPRRPGPADWVKTP